METASNAALMLQYFSGFPERMLIAALPFFIPMRRKPRWWLYLPALLVLLAGLVWLGMLAFPRMYSILSGEMIFSCYYILVIGGIALGIRFMCGCAWGEAFYTAVLAYVGEHLVHCAGTLAGHLLGSQPWWNGDAADWLIQAAVYVALYFLFARPVCRDGRYPVTATRSMSLLIIEMALMYFLSIYVADLGYDWLHAVYASLCILFILSSERRWILHTRAGEEMREKDRLYALNKAQYELTRDNIDIINRKCHDLRHQMDALRAVGTETDREQTMQAMRQAVRIYDTAFKTGNQSLDTVLMQKGLVCNENQIALSVIADGSLLDFIPPVDLYTMMANILDNAIEANLKISDPNHRAILLKVHENRGLTVVQAENPFEGEIRMEDGLPVTSKADRTAHGIGTRSIAATAAQYGGVMRIRAEKGIFVLRLIFQTPE